MQILTISGVKNIQGCFCYFYDHCFLYVDVPDHINYVTYESNENCSVLHRKLFCISDQNTQYNAKISHKAIISIVKLPISKQTIDDRIENTPTGKLIQYKCLTLNTDNCVISNNTFQLNVECK